MYWHPRDKEWLAARKAEWRQVKYNLNIMSSRYPDFKKSYHRIHQDLFFFGEVDEKKLWAFEYEQPPSERRRACIRQDGGWPFCGLLPIFLIWYHPQPETLDLEAMRTAYLPYGRLHGLREDLTRWLAGSPCGGPGYSLDPAYGGFNGREPLLARFIFPGLDPAERRVFPGREACPEEWGARPTWLRDYCLRGSVAELRKDAHYYPNHIGQFLWDHLSYAIEHYPHETLDEPISLITGADDPRRMLLLIMREVWHFHERTDPSRWRPSTIALVESLLQRVAANAFGPTLMALWQEAKTLTEVSAREAWEFDNGEEHIADSYSVKGFTVEKQREWRSRWQQVKPE